MERMRIYSASEYVARRARCIHSSYRTKDGRYIISEKDVMAALPFITPDELVHGFDIIPLTDDEAKVLIREGGYSIGEPSATAQAEQYEEQHDETPETLEESQENEEESVEQSNQEEE